MAKITLVSPVKKYSGRLATVAATTGESTEGIVVSKRNVARAYTIPSNPQSANQILVRSYMTQAAKGYSALSTATAELWNTAAAAITMTDTLGNTSALSGIQLYMKVNCHRLAAGLSLSSTVPSTTSAGTWTPDWTTTDIQSQGGTVTFTASTGTNALADGASVLTELYSLGTKTALLARAGDCRNQAATYSNAYKTKTQIGSTGIAFVVPTTWLNITTDYIGTFGLLFTFLNSSYYPTSSVLYNNKALQIGYVA